MDVTTCLGELEESGCKLSQVLGAVNLSEVLGAVNLSEVLGAVNLSEVLGVVISLLRMAIALKNLEAPFTSYGFWVDL